MLLTQVSGQAGKSDRESSKDRKAGKEKKMKAAPKDGTKRGKNKRELSRFEGNPFYEAFKTSGLVDKK